MEKSENISIFWFRQDLRISDNPGLTHAVESGSVLPIYILDDANSGEFSMGAASRWWLHHSLKKLNENSGIETANHSKTAPQNWERIKELIDQYPTEGVELLI